MEGRDSKVERGINVYECKLQSVSSAKCRGISRTLFEMFVEECLEDRHFPSH